MYVPKFKTLMKHRHYTATSVPFDFGARPSFLIFFFQDHSDCGFHFLLVCKRVKVLNFEGKLSRIRARFSKILNCSFPFDLSREDFFFVNFRDTWSVKIMATSDTKFDNTPEFIMAQIKKPSRNKLFVSCVYRRPSAMSLYLRFETLSAFIRPYHNIIVTGDFNANLLSPRKNETVILQNLINTNAFSILSTAPIRHLHHTDPPTHSRLDLFLVKHIESVVHFTKSD